MVFGRESMLRNKILVDSLRSQDLLDLDLIPLAESNALATRRFDPKTRFPGLTLIPVFRFGPGERLPDGRFLKTGPAVPRC